MFASLTRPKVLRAPEIPLPGADEGREAEQEGERESVRREVREVRSPLLSLQEVDEVHNRPENVHNDGQAPRAALCGHPSVHDVDHGLQKGGDERRMR